MTWRRHLVIFAKAPRLGAVKTRLARGLGTLNAWGFYRVTSARVIRDLATDTRWRTWLAVAPDRFAGRDGEIPVWPRHVPRLAQGSGDLGARMARIFARLGPGPVVIVGTDIPDLDRAAVWRAFRALGSHDAVFGPADDGGYWLIGLRSRALCRGLFSGVRWSSPHTLGDTRANLGAARVAFLDVLADVDTPADYAAWRARQISRRSSDAPPDGA